LDKPRPHTITTSSVRASFQNPQPCNTSPSSGFLGIHPVGSIYIKPRASSPQPSSPPFWQLHEHSPTVTSQRKKEQTPSSPTHEPSPCLSSFLVSITTPLVTRPRSGPTNWSERSCMRRSLTRRHSARETFPRRRASSSPA
ncbi:hypothetical protein CI238_06294, partial [Colletotrichum incanum]